MIDCCPRRLFGNVCGSAASQSITFEMNQTSVPSFSRTDFFTAHTHLTIVLPPNAVFSGSKVAGNDDLSANERDLLDLLAPLRRGSRACGIPSHTQRVLRARTPATCIDPLFIASRTSHKRVEQRKTLTPTAHRCHSPGLLYTFKVRKEGRKEGREASDVERQRITANQSFFCLPRSKTQTR